MPNHNKFAKKGFVAVIALLIIILMTPITQGCEYVDKEKVRELITRGLALQDESRRL